MEANGGENDLIDGKQRRPDGAWHYDLNSACKLTLFEYLEQELRAEHLTQWVALLELIRTRLGLPILEPTDTPESEAPAPREQGASDVVAVLTDRLVYPEYLRTSAIVLDPDESVPDDAAHLAFYTEGAVQKEVPVVVARYNHLLFSHQTVEQLRESGKPADVEVARLVDDALERDDSRTGRPWQVIMLSPPGDAATLVLDQPVVNTKTTTRGKAMAWAVGQRTTSLAALAKGPATTDELEQLGG